MRTSIHWVLGLCFTAHCGTTAVTTTSMSTNVNAKYVMVDASVSNTTSVGVSTPNLVSGPNYEGVILPPTTVSSFGLSVSGAGWTPTQADITALESRLVGFLQSESARQGSRVNSGLLSRLSRYRRQYVGIEVRGQRRVYVNLFCQSVGINWQTQVVSVDDGGDCFFQVQYDVTTNRFSDLVVNGHA